MRHCREVSTYKQNLAEGMSEVQTLEFSLTHTYSYLSRIDVMVTVLRANSRPEKIHHEGPIHHDIIQLIAPPEHTAQFPVR